MKVIEAFADFPAGSTLRGAAKQAFSMIQEADPKAPVLVIDPEGTAKITVKSGFTRAAGAAKVKVKFQNDAANILVKVSK